MPASQNEIQIGIIKTKLLASKNGENTKNNKGRKVSILALIISLITLYLSGKTLLPFVKSSSSWTIVLYVELSFMCKNKVRIANIVAVT